MGIRIEMTLHRWKTSGVALLSMGALSTTWMVIATGTAAQAHRDPAPTPITCSLRPPSGRHAEQYYYAVASRVANVPARILLAVSYLESQWDENGAAPSSSGGYGPMNLDDTGDRATAATGGVRLAARLTGLRALTLKRNAAANICGGAAVLARYQRQQGRRTGVSTPLVSWRGAVARYSDARSARQRRWFVHMVYNTIRRGEQRRTNVGQLVRLRPTPQMAVPPIRARHQQTHAARPSYVPPLELDCPALLTCVRKPAPYVQYGTTPNQYGNWDLGFRPDDLAVRYIVIHDTGRSWSEDLAAVSDPRRPSWHYTVRSDGAVAQHVSGANIARDTGNWWFDMHSIDVDVEGDPIYYGWRTEASYEASAWLVRHLAREFGVPMDRAHIIGEDEVPGSTSATSATMPTDPGPFWNWQHFMDLLRAPIDGTHSGVSAARTFTPGEVVTIKGTTYPGSDDVPGCGNPYGCSGEPADFLSVRQAPNSQAPLVADPGSASPGAPSGTDVSDVGARAVDGEQLVVAAVSGHWLCVQWLGRTGWIDDSEPVKYEPEQSQNVVPTQRPVLLATPKPGLVSAPLYGRAYPERSAYPSSIAFRPVDPLPYQMPAGQHYVVTDTDVPTDFFRASFDTSPWGANTVHGTDRYDQVWFGHRLMFVRAADVSLSQSSLPIPAANAQSTPKELQR